VKILGVVFLIYLVLFVIHAADDRANRFAFILWFPLIATPILAVPFFLAAFVVDASHHSQGPGAPLDGVATLFGLVCLGLSATFTLAAIRLRPTSPEAYRFSIVIPTVAV
jgi:hypothetical protein